MTFFLESCGFGKNGNSFKVVAIRDMIVLSCYAINTHTELTTYSKSNFFEECCCFAKLYMSHC